MYLLDTSIVIPLFRGRFKLQEKVDAVGLGRCCLSDLVIAELLVGAYQSGREREFTTIEYARNSFANLPVTEAVLARYAQIRAGLETTGFCVDSMDLLLAATAIENHCTLVTHNIRHFSRIPGLCLEDWIQEE